MTTEPDRNAPAPPAAGAGCWSVALIVVGGLVAAVSGFCTGAGIIGGVIDVSNGNVSLSDTFNSMVGYLVVSGLFLAGGVALIWIGMKLRRRK